MLAIELQNSKRKKNKECYTPPNGSSHTSVRDQLCTLFLSDAKPASVCKSVSHICAPLPGEEPHRTGSSTEPQTPSKNRFFISALEPRKDYGHIAEPSRVRRKE